MLRCALSRGWDGGNAVPAGWVQDAFSVIGALLSAIIVAMIGESLKEEAIIIRLMIQFKNLCMEKLMFLIKFLSWKC